MWAFGYITKDLGTVIAVWQELPEAVQEARSLLESLASDRIVSLSNRKPNPNICGALELLCCWTDQAFPNVRTIKSTSRLIPDLVQELKTLSTEYLACIGFDPEMKHFGIAHVPKHFSAYAILLPNIALDSLQGPIQVLRSMAIDRIIDLTKTPPTTEQYQAIGLFRGWAESSYLLFEEQHPWQTDVDFLQSPPSCPQMIKQLERNASVTDYLIITEIDPLVDFPWPIRCWWSPNTDEARAQARAVLEDVGLINICFSSASYGFAATFDTELYNNLLNKRGTFNGVSIMFGK